MIGTEIHPSIIWNSSHDLLMAYILIFKAKQLSLNWRLIQQLTNKS